MAEWYRYEDVRYAALFDETGPGRLAVELRRYPVVRTTPRGVVLDVYGMERFVRAIAKKRFACPTQAEALASFMARKRSQAAICEARARDARQAIAMAEHIASLTTKALPGQEVTP
jgi:hypothetical protein